MASFRTRRLCGTALAAWISLLGCGPAEREAPVGPSPGPCVDADGDGLGDGCARGVDCDDQDADVGSECVAEATAASDDDRAAVCEDGWTATCIVRIPTGEGAPLCFWGKRRCRDGAWGPCERLEDE